MGLLVTCGAREAGNVSNHNIYDDGVREGELCRVEWMGSSCVVLMDER